MPDTLTLYVITANTSDYPGRHVVRRHHVGPGTVGVDCRPVAVAADLDGARASVPDGLHRLPPDPTDDPVIVESWL